MELVPSFDIAASSNQSVWRTCTSPRRRRPASTAPAGASIRRTGRRRAGSSRTSSMDSRQLPSPLVALAGSLVPRSPATPSRGARRSASGGGTSRERCPSKSPKPRFGEQQAPHNREMPHARTRRLVAPTDMRGRSDRRATSRIDRRCSRSREECSTRRLGGRHLPSWKAPRWPGCMQSPKDKCNSCRHRRFGHQRCRTDMTRRLCRPRAGRRTGAALRPRPTFLTASCTPARRLAGGPSRPDRKGTSRAPGSGKPGKRPNPMRTTSKLAGSPRSRSSRRT